MAELGAGDLPLAGNRQQARPFRVPVRKPGMGLGRRHAVGIPVKAKHDVGRQPCSHDSLEVVQALAAQIADAAADHRPAKARLPHRRVCLRDGRGKILRPLRVVVMADVGLVADLDEQVRHADIGRHTYHPRAERGKHVRLEPPAPAGHVPAAAQQRQQREPAARELAQQRRHGAVAQPGPELLADQRESHRLDEGAAGPQRSAKAGVDADKHRSIIGCRRRAVQSTALLVGQGGRRV